MRGLPIKLQMLNQAAAGKQQRDGQFPRHQQDEGGRAHYGTRRESGGHLKSADKPSTGGPGYRENNRQFERDGECLAQVRHHEHAPHDPQCETGSKHAAEIGQAGKERLSEV